MFFFLTAAVFAGDRFEYEQTAMGCPVKLILYAEQKQTADTAAEAAFAEFQRINKIMSDYDSESELSKLNDTGAAGQWTKVGPDLWTVLKAAKHYCTVTDGTFDITVGPMAQLWRRSRRQKVLPKQQHLDAAKQLVGNALWEIDEKTQSVRLLLSGMKLDLGGIAKGYAIDKAFDIIVQHGITVQLVDAGGDMRAGDAPPKSAGWKVNLDGGETIFLNNTALATSGGRFQFVEIGGVRYSHIIDPKTGLGQTRIRSVHAAAPTAMQSDALATAAMFAD